MKQTSTARLELFIGSFILAGMILVAGMVTIWGGTGGILSTSYKVLVEIAHIGDLRVGAPIKLGGFLVGRVAGITMPAGKRFIEIECDIDARRDLAVDTEANIANAGLVGDTFLEFTAGKSQEVLPKVDRVADAPRIPGNGPVNMNQLLARMELIGVEVTGIVRNLNDVVGDEEVKKNIRSAIANANSATMEASRLLVSLRRSAANVQDATADAQKLVASLTRSGALVESAVNQTVGDQRNLAAVNDTLANLRALSRDARTLVERADRTLEREDKQLSAIVGNVKTITEQVKDVGEKAREMAKQMGPDKGIMRLFTSDDLKKEVEGAVEWLAGFVSEEGVIKALQLKRYADEIVSRRIKEWGTRIPADELEKKVMEQLQKGLGGKTEAKRIIRSEE